MSILGMSLDRHISGCSARHGIPGSQSVLMFSFTKQCQNVFHVVVQFVLSLVMYENVHRSTSFPTFGIVRLLSLQQLKGFKMALHLILICTSLISAFECLLMFVTISVSSYAKYLFLIFVQFSLVQFVFFLIPSKMCVFVRVVVFCIFLILTNPLSLLCVPSIFPQFVACLLPYVRRLLMNRFLKNHYNQMNNSFFVMFGTFGVMFKKYFPTLRS